MDGLVIGWAGWVMGWHDEIVWKLGARGVLYAVLIYDSARTLGGGATHPGIQRQDSMNRRLNRTISGTRSAIGMAGLAGVSLMGVGLGAMAGCVSYTNVPVPESAPAFESANHYQSIRVVRAALREVIEDHPVDGAYLVNLPAGTTPETFQKITSVLPGDPLMPTAEMRDQFAALPSYHIGRIWIRASDAKVDVIYPFTGIDGSVSEQNVTVWLSGGVRNWRVHRLQHWSAGTIPTPPIYVPIVEADQSALQEQEQEQTQEPVDDTHGHHDIQMDQVQSEPTGFDDTEIESLRQEAVEAEPVGGEFREVPLKSGD